MYLSIFIATFSIFIKKHRRLLTALNIYYLLYLLYWFFIATHQIRFLAPALVVSLILTAVAVSVLPKFLYSLLLFGFFTLLSLKPNVWNSYWATKLHLTDRQYGLGNISRTEFLTRNFSCQYLVIKYLDDNDLEGAVIDNWSVWHAPSVSFFADKNHFLTYGGNLKVDAQKLKEDLLKSNIRYLYFNSEVKKIHLSNPDLLVAASRALKIPTEEYILKNSDLFYSVDNCFLYKIKFDGFK